MIKLKKKQDTVKALFPIIVAKVKKKNQELDKKNKMKALEEKFGDLSILGVRAGLKNLLFIVPQNLEKKGEAFFTKTKGENIK